MSRATRRTTHQLDLGLDLPPASTAAPFETGHMVGEYNLLADLQRLDPSWLAAMRPAFEAPYLRDLSSFLDSAQKAGVEIYPPGPDRLNALLGTPLSKVRVVIFGQDPYVRPGQAHGLSFSVRRNVPKPPSLLNILKELRSDLGHPMPDHGCLEAWADQGVLMLNAVLTVERGKMDSHAGKGWEQFTDAVTSAVNALPHPVIFVLWGAKARTKERLIDATRHHVLKSAHPSPRSAFGGFFGSRPFSTINAILEARGDAQIDWRL